MNIHSSSSTRKQRKNLTKKTARILEERFDAESAQQITQSFLRTDNAPVLRTSTLTQSALRALLERRCVAIHVPGYFDSALARRAARMVLTQAKNRNFRFFVDGKWIRTDTNYEMGIPFEFTKRDEVGKRKYLKAAIPSIRKIRGLFSPYLSPMDQLRLELDEIWPAGAELRPFEGQKGFAGIIRVIKPQTLFPGAAGKHGLCHTDALPFDTLFSSNLYLQIPKQGGALSIWNIALAPELRYNPLYQLLRKQTEDPEIQEVLHELLPSPLKIQPHAGDLILLDTSRPHAVGGFLKGARVAIQSFIISDRETQRLRFSS